MTLTEYRAKREVIEQMVARFKFIVPGCQQCKHFDFGRCAVNGNEPIPAEFIGQREECETWEHDEIPF